jgi:hypothetical protein
MDSWRAHDQYKKRKSDNQEVFKNRQLSKPSEDPTPLQEVFGLPPDNLLPETTRKIRDSMPICHFQPSIPRFTRGLDLFYIDSAWTTNTSGAPSYIQLLEEHGFQTNNSAGQGIKVAYLADSFPTDTFTNEYGENFLQKFTDVASEGAASIAQMMGTTSAFDAIQRMTGPLLNMVPTTFLGSKINPKESIQSGLTAMKKTATQILNATKMQNTKDMIGRLAAGARIDFPQIWKSSGFQPSYTMTIRLYNPNPRSFESTRRYIIGPIVALMLLAVPITQDGSTYNWPFLHKITSPGIFELNPGFISNITVIKGGDQQQISQQQNLAMVDVRIDVGSLYSTMVAGSPGIQQKTRPTVKSYVNAMLSPTPRRHEIFDRQGIYELDSKTHLEQLKMKEAKFRELDRKLSRSQSQKKKGGLGGLFDRVPKLATEIGKELIKKLPIGF